MDAEQTRARIKAILYDRGWTVKRLARETGYTFNHTARVLRGDVVLTVRFLLLAETALNLPAGFLSERGKVA